MQEDSVCYGEIRSRQTCLPQDLFHVQCMQQDTWVSESIDGRVLCCGFTKVSGDAFKPLTCDLVDTYVTGYAKTEHFA